MRNLIVDDVGEFRQSHLVWSEIGPQLSYAAFEDFCVRNMGYVSLTESRTGVRLHWRPAIVAPQTQAAVLRWLTTTTPDRVLVTTQSACPSIHLCADGRAAANLIVSLLKEAQIDTPELRRTRIPLGEIRTQHTFGALIDRWKQTGGVYHKDHFHDLLTTTFSRRFVTLEPSEATSDLYVRDVGDGFSILDKSWFTAASGRKFSDQPDVRYGYWATQAYQDALSSAEPVIEHVDVILKQPRRRGVRATYDRIILPCKTPNGGHLLLGATLMGDSRVAE